MNSALEITRFFPLVKNKIKLLHDRQFWHDAMEAKIQEKHKLCNIPGIMGVDLLIVGADGMGKSDKVATGQEFFVHFQEKLVQSPDVIAFTHVDKKPDKMSVIKNNYSFFNFGQT